MARSTTHLPKRAPAPRARPGEAGAGGPEGPGGMFWGAVRYVDRSIGHGPANEAALRRAADLFPSSCVFDGRGRVLWDSGAMRHVEAVACEPAERGRGAAAPGPPVRITVKCKRPRPYPPLLSVIGPCDAAVSVRCLRKLDWVFTLDYGPRADPGSAFRYRLEIG